MKHLYVLMSWPEDMDMLWIKFVSFVSVFCSVSLSCFIIVHIFKDKHIVAGGINSLNLLVFNLSRMKWDQVGQARHGISTLLVLGLWISFVSALT